MIRIGAVVAACVVTVSLGLAPQAASSSAPTTGGPAVVDLHAPESLPDGDPPQSAYLVEPDRFGQQPHRIFRPGKSPLRTGRGSIGHLMRVRNGFVVRSFGAGEIRFVGDNGRRHVISRTSDGRYIEDAVASVGGRLVAVTVESFDDDYTYLRVHRIADGKVVARHRFGPQVFVSSFTRERALLTPWFDEAHKVTRWWNVRTDKVRAFDDGGRLSSPSTPAGDLTAVQVAVLRKKPEGASRWNRVVTIPKKSERSWRTSPGEFVQSWSPDDRYVLTAPEDGLFGSEYVNVRRARDGALVTTFTGAFEVDGLSHWRPTWEDNDTLVITAMYNCDDGCYDSTQVRCTVAGDCEQLGLPEDQEPVEIRRLP